MSCLGVGAGIAEETGGLRNFQNKVGGTWVGGQGGKQCLGSLFGRGLTIKSHRNLEIESRMIVISVHLLGKSRDI